MKLLGGDWSRGDVLAFLGVLVAVVSAVAALLVVPEVRRRAGLELDPNASEPPPTRPAPGRPPTEAGRPRAIASSYKLGRKVAWWSYYQTKKGKLPELPDPEHVISQKGAELEAALKDEGIAIDYTKLDYLSNFGAKYQDSEAAHYLRDEIQQMYGAEAVRAYRLGLALEAAIHQAQDGEFNYDLLSSRSAEITLTLLNEDSQHFGAQGVPKKDLNEAVDVAHLNRLMLILLVDLEGQLKDSLH